MKKLLASLVLLIVLAAVAAALVARDARVQLQRPLALAEQTTVDLPAGSTLRAAIDDLHAREVLQTRRQGWYLEAWARWHEQSGDLHAGEYALEPGMSALDVLALWVSGKTVMHELRIIEGMRAEQVFRLVAAHPEIDPTLGTLDAATVMAALGVPDLHPEGRFFPDTYRFGSGTSDLTVLRRAFEAMQRVLDEEWALRDPTAPVNSPSEALTLASIVEKETGLASERPAIAGVFARRLTLGMRLQTDPTVIYGIGERFDGNIRRSDLTTDTPYNTYTRAGLPPTPICLPGRAAIRAALHPADGDALYFVSRGDGSHQFSATLAEHQAAVRRYQLGQRP